MTFVILERVRDTDTGDVTETGYDLSQIAQVNPHKEIKACWIVNHVGRTVALVAGSLQEVVAKLNEAGARNDLSA